MGDLRHQALPSDHNDGNAFDLTHDPANGCDAHRLVHELVARRDPRVKYVISNRQIWSTLLAAKGWRPYSGSNPHTKHAHVSITWAARGDTSPWWGTPSAVRRIDSLEVDMVVNVYEVGIATDSEGRGWLKVPYRRSRIIGHTCPGIRPDADHRYQTAEVGFAEEGDGTVVSVTEWAPNDQAVVTLSVVN